MSTLSPDRWQEVSPYLDQVLSLPEDKRAAWMESFRAERPDLADLLQELLRGAPGGGTGAIPRTLAGSGCQRLIFNRGEDRCVHADIADWTGRYGQRVAGRTQRWSI